MQLRPGISMCKRRKIASYNSKETLITLMDSINTYLGALSSAQLRLDAERAACSMHASDTSQCSCELKLQGHSVNG